MKKRPASLPRKLGLLYRKSALLQVALLIALWGGCQAVVTATRLPLPAGVLGFFLLVLGLQRRWIAPALFHRGAAGLLDHLSLFFVPAMVALIGKPELFGTLGLKLLLAVVVGTLLVMGSTVLVVDLWLRASLRAAPAGDSRSLPPVSHSASS